MRWLATCLLAFGLLQAAAAEVSLSKESIREVFEGIRNEIELPLSDGQTLTFQLQSTDLLPQQTESAIRTLSGYAVEDSHASVSIVITPDSLSAQIFCRGQAFYLSSINSGADTVALEFENGPGRAASDFQCLSETASSEPPQHNHGEFITQSAHLIRTFRLAAGATAEFTQFFGSKEEAVRQVVTAISRANDIFYRELGISFQLVPGFERMVFTDPATDPFSSNEPTEDLLKETQAAFDAMIGTENYDLGIILTRGTFGLAYIRSVCDPEQKGSSCIGLPEPVGAAFHVNLVTHELAHQFGANHTFNSPTGLCLERRNHWAAFEPGAGSTIMSYSSLPCEGDSFQEWHDPYFHFESIKEIRAFLNSGLAECGTTSPAGNSAPIVSAGPEHFVPVGTPFALTASATDPEGDDMTFCWEERDLGPAQPLGAPDNGMSPLFRSFPPGNSPTRVFPSLEHILMGTDAPEERLPQTNRMLRFRVTVRDTHHHGAVSWADTQLKVTNVAGPFRITSHNAPETLRGSTLVEWSTGGTAGSPFFAGQVRILLSTNAGRSFPIVLAEATPNDGSERVRLPEIESDDVRIKVEPTNNVFFDINDAPLILRPSGELRLEASAGSSELQLSWPSRAGRIYRLEKSSQLPAPDWVQVLRTNAADSRLSVALPSNGAAAYFRLVEE